MTEDLLTFCALGASVASLESQPWSGVVLPQRRGLRTWASLV